MEMHQHYNKKLNYGIGIIVKNVIYKYDTYFSIEFGKIVTWQFAFSK